MLGINASLLVFFCPSSLPSFIPLFPPLISKSAPLFCTVLSLHYSVQLETICEPDLNQHLMNLGCHHLVLCKVSLLAQGQQGGTESSLPEISKCEIFCCGEFILGTFPKRISVSSVVQFFPKCSLRPAAAGVMGGHVRKQNS